MKYCSNCLQPDTRPGTKFSDEGICPACDYYEKYKQVDWAERAEILLGISEEYRNSSAQYDCIIGVSGGKDSFRQALWVRDYLKLRPLLVCVSYPPHQLTEIGSDNVSALIESGFDLIQICPAPETWRKLMAVAFDKYANWAKATELALFAGVPRVAIDYKIPLILWGENPGLQLGDLNTLGKFGYDGNNLRNMNTLDGGGLQWMLEEGFEAKDLIPYDYPSVKEFENHNIQIIYLGWFLGDWSLLNNGAISSMLGIKIRSDKVNNTGDLYGVSSLDDDWVTLNQMIKYYKFGFGRATDYVNEMVRIGTISRSYGIELVEKYDGVCSDEYIHQFCEFIGITVHEFWEKVVSVVDKDLFTIVGPSEIKRKVEVGTGELL